MLSNESSKPGDAYANELWSVSPFDSIIPNFILAHHS